MSYSEKLRDPRWQKKRLEILNRDEFTCRLCEDKEATLHVHHLEYKSGCDPWQYENNNFLTLCEHCHLIVEHLRKLANDTDDDSTFKFVKKIIKSKARVDGSYSCVVVAGLLIPKCFFIELSQVPEVKMTSQALSMNDVLCAVFYLNEQLEKTFSIIKEDHFELYNNDQKNSKRIIVDSRMRDMDDPDEITGKNSNYKSRIIPGSRMNDMMDSDEDDFT